MGHIACLSLNELKVNWDKRGSGAVGLRVHLRVFVCFICGVVKGVWGEWEGDGVSKQFGKEQPGQIQGDQVVFDCLGLSNL